MTKHQLRPDAGDVTLNEVTPFQNLLQDPSLPGARANAVLGVGSPLMLEDATMYLVPDTEGPLRSLLVIRHGATKLNATDVNSVDRIRGWSDVPLSDLGRDDVRRTARALRGSGVVALVHSDLCRASETAAIIADALGIKTKSTKNLRPWDLGIYTGQPTPDVLPGIVYYIRQAPDEVVPEGESFNSFKNRSFNGVAQALKAYPQGLVGIVTHHRVERLLKAWDAIGQPRDRSLDLDTIIQLGSSPAAAEHMHIKAENLVRSEKATKVEAHYRLGTDDARCDMCTMFRRPRACTSVEGDIAPEGLCDYYARKANVKGTGAR